MKEVISFNNFIFANYKYKLSHSYDASDGASLNFIAYIKKGHCEITLGRSTVSLNRGDVFFIPRGICYRSFWHGEDGVDFLSFGFYDLHIGENLGFELQKINCNADLIKKLCAIPTGLSMTCRGLSLFYDAMNDIIPLMKRGAKQQTQFLTQKAKNYIYENPACSVKDIAGYLSVSESTLYTLFRKTEKTSPNNFRQMVLCRKACDLLTSTDKSVEEISSMLNFSSGSYFRKIFKKHIGVSPRGFRKCGLL